MITERVYLVLDNLGTTNVFAGDRGQHGGRALNSCALQVVIHGADATELFTTSSAPRATVFEHR